MATLTAVSLETAPPPENTKSFGARLWEYRWCYLFMVPTTVLAVLFTFYPMINSWVIAFQEWNGITEDRTWVGLANFREILADPFFWRAFGRTGLFVLMVVPTSLLIALLIAIVLNDYSYRLRPLFRTVFFLPVVTTTAIVGIVSTMILNPFDGPLNQALLTIGVIDAPIDFLGDPNVALWSVAGVYVWKWMGISMIYWLVALQTVPRELLEAAAVDGAPAWKQHRHITVPMVMPFAVIITLIAVVGAFQTFPLVQAMTRGGPSYATELMELFIYRLAFASAGEPRLGYASAAAVIFGLAVLVFTLLQAWGVKKVAQMRSGS
ncbi:carbohydrate ABC transporter permease [Georgenia alba]|uniref:Carbohydrate ABC transporter permease n=1 Tax=Georgenia alba TaxID=2233858 RepID=A0ABW2QEM6_9MICO